MDFFIIVVVVVVIAIISGILANYLERKRLVEQIEQEDEWVKADDLRFGPDSIVNVPANRNNMVYVSDGDFLTPEHINSIIDEVKALRESLAPAKAIIKCAHCGSWAARYSSCSQCGAVTD